MNRRNLLAVAAASPVFAVSSLALAAINPDPVVALVSEWNAISASIDAGMEDVLDDDPRLRRQVEIDAEIMAGVAPTTLAGVVAGLAHARNEIAPQQYADRGPPSAREVFAADPGLGLAVAMIDAAVIYLERVGL
jgi:hypothetical protein